MDNPTNKQTYRHIKQEKKIKKTKTIYHTEKQMGGRLGWRYVWLADRPRRMCPQSDPRGHRTPYVQNIFYCLDSSSISKVMDMTTKYCKCILLLSVLSCHREYLGLDFPRNVSLHCLYWFYDNKRPRLQCIYYRSLRYILTGNWA